MLIAHISDCHIELPATDGSDRAGDLSRSVEYVNGLADQPDLGGPHRAMSLIFGKPE